MSGTIIVTGAAGGLGFAIAETILQRRDQYTSIFTVRDEDAPNAKPLHDLVQSNTSNKQTYISGLDLSKSASIQSFCANINSRVSSGELPPIRALILNAAFISHKSDRIYAEFDPPRVAKLEMTFAVNHLANVQLSLLLLKSIDKQAGRILYVSSMASDPVKAKVIPAQLLWDPEDFAFAKQQPPASDEAPDAMRRYGISKLCQIMFMQKLQEHLDSTPSFDKLRVIGIDPGVMVHPNLVSKYSNSAFVKRIIGPAFMWYTKVAQSAWPNGTFRTVKKSAADIVSAALDLDELNGDLQGAYMNGSKREQPAALSKDEDKRKDIWNFSLNLIDLNEREVGLC